MTRVCVIRTAGTNCDRETKYAFECVGAQAEIVHMNSLIEQYDPVAQKKVKLEDFNVLAIPGGFSNGDYIASGKIFARDLEHFLNEDIVRFVERGKPVIGICNGFQVLVKYGLLPRMNGEVKQTTTLTYNDSQRYEDRWVRLVQPFPVSGPCIWTRGIPKIELPVAHGEGKFEASQDVIDELFRQKLVVFQYAGEDGQPTMSFPANPNGSTRSIAGICNPKGTVFGLMPHPERYNSPMNHPLAQLQKIKGELPREGLGLEIFRNAVEYVK